MKDGWDGTTSEGIGLAEGYGNFIEGWNDITSEGWDI